MATWREDIATALETLGGIGSYQEIYAEVAQLRLTLTPAWQETVRRTIQMASSDSAGHVAGAVDLFYAVHGIGQGTWGLRDLQDEPAVAEIGDSEHAHQGQGYAVDSVVRVAIEQHAVKRAVTHYQQTGADDIEELGKPYDLKVRSNGSEIHVEVKGSTRRLTAVTLTRNEVLDSRATGTNELYVVDEIELRTAEDGQVTTHGGRDRIFTAWVPAEESLTPLTYAYTLP